jgi:Ca2+-binding EF-hand superfamily protein
MKKMLAVIAIAAFGASANAGDPGKWFEKVDANADGYLSADELGEKKAYKIQKLDMDGDGLISREEYLSHKAHKKHKKDDSV